MTLTGQYLARCRTDRHLSKYAVSKATGVSHSVIFKLESGQRFATPEAFVKLARHYQLTPPERQEMLHCIMCDLAKPYRTLLNQIAGGQP